jgi:hypothetical protein
MKYRLIFVGLILIGCLLLGVGVYLAVAPKVPLKTPDQDSYTEPSKPHYTGFTQTMTVPATAQWFDTGYEVKSGQHLRIEYKSGTWTNKTGSNLVDGRGKSGYEKKSQLLVPSSELAALVAKVGNRSFHVGNFYEGTSGGDGHLYLSLNDLPNTYYDNEGQLQVEVSIR